MTETKINPLTRPLISVLASVLSYQYTHKEIDLIFPEIGFPDDPPEGSKAAKVEKWLWRLNKLPTEHIWKTIGKALEEFMENDPVDPFNEEEIARLERNRERVREQLGRYGLAYHQGGVVAGMGFHSAPTLTLEQSLKGRDYPSLDREFHRAVEKCETEPEDAVTAACTILESLFKIVIEENGLERPKEQSILNLWHPVRTFFKLNKSVYLEEDALKNITQGLGSIVQGIAELRTRRGTAHGQGKTVYRVESRHARLAVSASHTLARFIFDLWDRNEKV